MSLAVAILFILLGILIKYGKLYFLIAGYNTMSKEKQEQYDIDGIATVFRNAMFGMALVMLIGFAISEFTGHPEVDRWSFIVAMVIGLPYLLIVSNSDAYKIDKQK